MTRNVLEGVNKARKIFGVKDFPGNFFSILEKEDYSLKYDLFLFKEDLDKLSGFIGYVKNNMSVICINYKRSIGHQNFTLAHEVGHWFLHKGKSLSDDDRIFNQSGTIEKEANWFAKELLYPEEFLVKDYYLAVENDLFYMNNRSKLGDFVNALCHKYCLSFEIVLRNLLFKNKQAQKYKEIREEIEKSKGSGVAEAYDKDFYVPNMMLPEYQQLKTPYQQLENKVDIIVDRKKISFATGDAIKLRNRMENI